MRGRRAITVSELLVAMGILGLLGVLTVVLFRTGASGWKKIGAQSDLLSDYQVFSEKVARESHRSAFASASVANHADGTTLAFLSAMDDTGTFVIDESTFTPIWQKYLVFYWDKPSRQIFLAEVELATPSTAVQRLEDYDEGTGDLNDYRKGGRLLMTNVDHCSFELLNTMLTVEIAASKLRYGDEEPETLSMLTSVAFRN